MNGMGHHGRTVIATPSLEGQCRWIVIVCVCVFLLQTAWHTVTELLALNALAPRPWQFLTYAFCHGDPWHLVFNMVTVWMLGTSVESTLGRRRYPWFLLLCAFIPGLIWYLAYRGTQAILLGFSGAGFGILYAFAFFFPHRHLILIIFPIRSRTLVALLVAISLWSLLAAPGGGVAHSVHLVGLAVAAIYLDLLQGSHLRRLTDRVSRRFADLRFRWKSRHLTVIRGTKRDTSSDRDSQNDIPPNTPIH